MAEAPCLLERATELDALQRALDAAAGGSGAALLLTGEAGIGKSALLERAATLAAGRGFQVLRARGVPVESTYAFGGLRQLLAPAVRGLGGDLTGALPGASRAVVPQVLGLTEGPAPADPFAVHHGVYWTMDLLASRAPVAVVVDDAQWLDAPSMAALLFAARRVAEVPVAMLFAWRTGEADPQGMFAELLEIPGIAHLEPRPLSTAATAAVLDRAGMAASADLVDACRTATGGNPFLLTELADALPTDADPGAVAELGPTEVIRGVTGRLRRLPPVATAVARAVAVLDGDAEAGWVAAVAGVEIGVALDAVDLLAEARLVTVDGRLLAFRHPLLRSAVYRAMTVGERSAAHRAAAEHLARDQDTADRGAAHLLEVVPAGDMRVVDQLQVAARRAVAAGAPGAAVRLLRRALAERAPRETTTLWADLGHAQLVAGDPEAVPSLRRALTEDPAPAVRVAVTTDLCQALSANELADEAIETLRLEVDRLASSNVIAASELRSLAVIGLAHHRTASWTTATVGALVDAGVTDDVAGRRLLLTHAYARALVSDGPAAEVRRIAEPALRPGWWREHPGSAMTPLYAGLATLLWTGQVERAANDATEVIQDAERAGDLLRLGGACYWASAAAWLRGDLAEAEDLARRALEHSRASVFLHRMAVAALLQSLVERGRSAECEEVLDREGLTGPLPDTMSGACAAYARTAAYLANDRVEAALADTVLLGSFTAERGGFVPGWGRPQQDTLVRIGRTDLAAGVAEQALAQARAWGEPGTLGVALRDAGRLDPTPEGRARLAEGVALLDASPLALDLASALVDQGSALRRAGQAAEARAPLARAADIAHRCGAVRLRDAAQEELRLSGAHPRRLAITGVDALTPAEYRVARRAADGLTNAELCQALFLTRSTVEKHLTSAYRKLGVSSRGQLRESLAPASAADPSSGSRS